MANLDANTENQVIAGGLHQADIIARLAKRDARITKLSERVGLARTTLQASLYKADATTAHRVIAAALGMSLHDLFPDWYGPDNKARARIKAA